MQGGTKRGRVHRRGDEIVPHLGGDADDYDFAFEEGAIRIIRVPEFRIENLVERPRRVGVIFAETKRMLPKVRGTCRPRARSFARARDVKRCKTSSSG